MARQPNPTGRSSVTPQKASAAPTASNGVRRLVIVESPAKAKKIKGYLGTGYEVEASIGHIRDLPTPAELPPEMKKGPFGRFAVDVDNGFEAYYVVDADKRSKVAELKRMLKNADELLLATDEDREGEAIAWHLLEVLKPKVPVKRMVFNEITRDAIRRAVDNTRDLDTRLVDAQETRRILDRLYGYEVSPVLWRKVRAGLSAGRVQSVATRMVVERERERIAFRSAQYWDLAGTFAPTGVDHPFAARLVEVAGKRVATGRDFGSDGVLKAREGAVVALDGPTVRQLAAGARDRALRGALGRGQALHPPPGGTVHHLDAAAGGQPQAAASAPRPRCGWPSGCMRTATSPICGPTPPRFGRGADRRPRPGPGDLRPGVRPGRPAPLRQQGQERPGGARGDPPVGGLLPHPRRAGRRAQPRRARALRPDLEAHRRLPDGRRPGQHRLGPARRPAAPTGATRCSAPAAP